MPNELSPTPVQQHRLVFNVLYILISALILYLYILYNKMGLVNRVGFALMDFIAIGPVLIIPLIFGKSLKQKIVWFLGLFIPFTLIGMWWTRYPDFTSFIFFFYDIIIFILILVGHKIVNKLTHLSKHSVSITVMGVIMLSLFITVFNMSANGIRHFNANSIRCNDILINEFASGCKKFFPAK